LVAKLEFLPNTLYSPGRIGKLVEIV